MKIVQKQVKLEPECEKSESPPEMGQVARISADWSPQEPAAFSPLSAGQLSDFPGKKSRVWLCGISKIFHFCSFAALQLGTVSAFPALPETLLLTGVAIPKAGRAGLAVPGTIHALK